MRPKNCKKCGGKMQLGSYFDKTGQHFKTPTFNDLLKESMAQSDLDATPAEEIYQRPEINPMQDAISKGIIEAPRADSPDDQMTAQQWYDMANGQPSQKKKKNPYDLMRQIGIGVRGFRTGLGWLAGAIERGRQNQYDYKQQTALGQMNPMQSSDFQPNPYNLYMQQGGNLKSIMKDYNKWTNDAQFDFGSGDDDKGKMKKGGYEIDRMLIVRKFLPELLHFGRLTPHTRYRNYQVGGQTENPYFTQANQSFNNAMNQNVPKPSYNFNLWTALLSKDPTGYPEKYGSAGREIPVPSAQDSLDYRNNMMNFIEGNKRALKRFSKGEDELSRSIPLLNMHSIGKLKDEFSAYNDAIKEKQKVNLGIYQAPPPVSKKPFKRGGIHIKPENKGKFTDYCGGKVTDECIQKGLDSPSATIRKRANFARNARKWNH